MELPILMTGDYVVDDRGGVSFVNDFTFKDVKRFYTVHNHRPGFARDWHGHKGEFKYVTTLSGSAIIAVVAINDWKNPDKNAKVHRYVISAHRPKVLYIPPGYANSFMALEENTRVMFFSNLTVEQSKGDDYRYPANYWNPWEIQGGRTVL